MHPILISLSLELCVLLLLSVHLLIVLLEQFVGKLPLIWHILLSFEVLKLLPDLLRSLVSLWVGNVQCRPIFGSLLRVWDYLVCFLDQLELLRRVLLFAQIRMVSLHHLQVCRLYLLLCGIWRDTQYVKIWALIIKLVSFLRLFCCCKFISYVQSARRWV